MHWVSRLMPERTGGVANFVKKSPKMNSTDILRKIELLRNVKPENGAFDSEVDNAARLEKVLMDRYAVKAEEVPNKPAPAYRMTWVYWEHLVEEFGFELRRFGRRGNVTIGGNRIVYIKLESGQWWVEEKSAGGWNTLAKDWGVESLREYLSKHAPRSYAFFRR
jgi:hypothetical protein